MPKSFKNTTDRTRQLWTPPESNLESLNQEFASFNFSVYLKTQSDTSPRAAKQAASWSWSIANTKNRLSALLLPSEMQQCPCLPCCTAAHRLGTAAKQRHTLNPGCLQPGRVSARAPWSREGKHTPEDAAFMVGTLLCFPVQSRSL